MSERLQKYLARAGVSSRRHAEELITAGRVQVNNAVVTELGTKVEAGKDLVTVDGKLVAPPESPVYFVLYKPIGVVTTLEDPQGRPTVAEMAQEEGRRLFPVGRLDYDAEGALLLTDDGQLAHQLLHPSFQVPRSYLAKVKGEPTEATLEKLRGGVRLEDGEAKPQKVSVVEVAERNTWLLLVVTEGRPHLVKRLCAAVGHPVVRLFRPAYAGITVEGLQPGQRRELSREELELLKDVAAGRREPPAAPVRLPARRHGRAGEVAEAASTPGGRLFRGSAMPPEGEEEGAHERKPERRGGLGEKRPYQGGKPGERGGFREKRPYQRAKPGERGGFGEKRPYQRAKPGERGGLGEKRPYQRAKPGERGGFGEKRPYERAKPGERGGFGEKRPYQRAKPGERGGFGEKRPYQRAKPGERGGFGEKRPYERAKPGERGGFGEKRPYQRAKPGERGGFGEKRPYQRAKPGERGGFGEKRPYERAKPGERGGFGEKRPYQRAKPGERGGFGEKRPSGPVERGPKTRRWNPAGNGGEGPSGAS